MRALLVVAHGSRRQASNDEVGALASVLAARVADRYDYVREAFLEMAEPDIATGLQACVDAGAKQIDVLPYFLSAGRHVVTDVPEDVAKVATKYPDIEISILPYVGQVAGMVDLLAEICSPPAAK
jgi:sirohydrochlorin ferrochelatase